MLRPATYLILLHFPVFCNDAEHAHAHAHIKIHHVQSHDYANSYIIIIKSDRLLSTHHTSRPPGGEDRYHAAERPTVVPEDAETFLFHFHGSPVEIATAGCLVPTGVCEFTSSRFPPFFLLTREHVGGTSERRHTRGTRGAV